MLIKLLPFVCALLPLHDLSLVLVELLVNILFPMPAKDTQLIYL